MIEVFMMHFLIAIKCNTLLLNGDIAAEQTISFHRGGSLPEILLRNDGERMIIGLNIAGFGMGSENF